MKYISHLEAIVRYFILALGICFALLFPGCSRSSNLITPGSYDLLNESNLENTGCVLGAYLVHVDADTQTVSMEQVRSLSAIGDSYLLAISEGGPAGKWFRINGLQLVEQDSARMKDTLQLDVSFKHPFDINTRPDLCGWDLKAILFYDGNATSFNYFNIKMNPPVLKNSHGATGEWDDQADLIYPTDADIHEFIILSEDPVANTEFNFQNPSGWNVFYPGMTAMGNLDIEIDTGSSLDFMLFMTMGYETSATFRDTVNNPGNPGSRTNPVYNPPNGNSRSPWKVEIEELRTGQGMTNQQDSETTYQVRAWDWHHAISGSDSRIEKISVFIPQVTSEPVESGNFSGTGRGDDPVKAEITVTNDLEAEAGDYLGLVRVSDSLTGMSNDINGMKTDWKSPFTPRDFDTYKPFAHTIERVLPDSGNLFDVALSQMGKVRDDLYWGRTSESIWKNGDEDYFYPVTYETRSPDFNSYHRNPLQFEDYVDDFTSDLETCINHGDYSGVIVETSKRLGYSTGTCNYLFTPGAEPLLDAIKDLYQYLGEPMDTSTEDLIRFESDDIPLELQLIAAECLSAIIIAHGKYEEAWEPFDYQVRYDLWWNFISWDDFGDLLIDMNFGKVHSSAAVIASLFENLKSDIAAFDSDGDYSFEWLTPIGEIVIKGNLDDGYTLIDGLLVIDTSGNDCYRGYSASNTSMNNTISILLDFCGNDEYGNGGQDMCIAGGNIGIAALWDISGNDLYEGNFFTQGAGYFGSGMLIDSEGDDNYEGDTVAQGAGDWGGLGFLIDESGTDRYYSFNASQAFSHSRGAGILIDINGDDDYIADDVTLRYPSPETQEHNSSLCQGVSLGYCSIDPVINIPGGISALLDFDGSDDYSCGVFGQGASFVYSTAILKDYGDGDDSFSGVWYVQGSALGCSAGYFFNENGNDSYTSLEMLSQGAGYDFSHAWFIDLAGDDIYNAPNMSLGAGLETGIGFFIDYDGEDQYFCNQSDSIGCGVYSDVRQRDSYGVFVDDGGDVDTYTKSGCTNDSYWSSGQVGGSADGEST
jgi:hypothetical protein